MESLPIFPKEFEGLCLYPCDDCEELFTEILFLLKHQEMKHRIPTKNNKSRGTESLEENYLPNSEKKQDPDELCELCEICEKFFPNTSALIVHKNSKHNNEEDNQNIPIGMNYLNSVQYCCNLCPELFKNASNLLLENNENNLLKFIKNDHDYSFPEKVCEICKIPFSKCHRKINLKSGQESFICNKCIKSYYNIKELNNEKYKTKQRLKQTRLIEDGQKEHICRKCNRTFTTRKYLRKHMKRQNDCTVRIDNIKRKEKAIMFQCSYCSKRFKEKKDLEWHNLNHTGLICSYCSKSFTELGRLKVHERRHTGEKPFSCNQCDAKFTQNVGLKQHKFIHITERPITCKECGKCFKCNKDLGKHMLVHKQDKLLCNFCPKTFSQKINMKTHERTHTGEKPFKCIHCDKKFSHNVVLKDHIKKHTMEILDDESNKDYEHLDEESSKGPKTLNKDPLHEEPSKGLKLFNKEPVKGLVTTDNESNKNDENLDEESSGGLATFEEEPSKGLKTLDKKFYKEDETFDGQSGKGLETLDEETSKGVETLDKKYRRDYDTLYEDSIKVLETLYEDPSRDTKTLDKESRKDLETLNEKSKKFDESFQARRV